jgi:hypothetical protein
MGEGPSADALRARLETRGEGPYALALRTSDATSVGTLDQARTHGVPIELVAE